jgi:hypothetical protein
VVGETNHPNGEDAVRRQEGGDARRAGESREQADSEPGERGPGDEVSLKKGPPRAVGDGHHLVAGGEQDAAWGAEIAAGGDVAAPPRAMGVDRQEGKRGAAGPGLEDAVEDRHVGERGGQIERRLAGGSHDHHGFAGEGAGGDERLVSYRGDVIVPADDARMTRPSPVTVGDQRDPGAGKGRGARDRERRLAGSAQRGPPDGDHGEPLPPSQRASGRPRGHGTPHPSKRARPSSSPLTPFEPLRDLNAHPVHPRRWLHGLHGAPRYRGVDRRS